MWLSFVAEEIFADAEQFAALNGKTQFLLKLSDHRGRALFTGFDSTAW